MAVGTYILCAIESWIQIVELSNKIKSFTNRIRSDILDVISFDCCLR